MSLLRFVVFIILAILPFQKACSQSIWIPDTTIFLQQRLPFNSVKIIDLRVDKENIGFLKTGAFNRYMDFITDGAPDTAFTVYANRLVASSLTPGKLLILLHSFRAEDRKGGEEIGTMSLSAELFILSGEGYRYLNSVDTFYESKSGWDVTKWVRKSPSEAIADLLRIAALQAAVPGDHDAKIYSEEAAAHRQDSLKALIPLYAATEYPRGIYRTLDDLLQLKSDGPEFIDRAIPQPEGPSRIYFYYKNEKGKKGKEINVEDCYALSDGKRLFITRNDRFTTLVKRDNNFYANLFSKGLTDNSAAMGFAFGIIGSIAASSDHGLHKVLYVSRLLPQQKKFVVTARVR